MSSIPSLIIAAAQAQGVDPSLALEVANVESGFNQNAVSSAGAIGVMQLMPETAADLGVDPTNLQENIQGGVTYLAQLISEFGGDVSSALAAYNWGPGNVQNLQDQYGSSWLTFAPASVQSYVSTILANQSSEYAKVIGIAPTVTAAAAPAPSTPAPANVPSVAPQTSTFSEAGLLPVSTSGAVNWTMVGVAAVVFVVLAFALGD